MLRSLVPTENPLLLRLCVEKKWAEVCVRSETHPSEAEPTPDALRGSGSTALAIAVRSSPPAPLDAIQALTEACPAQLTVKNTRRGRGTVLHDAMRHRNSLDVLSYLIKRIDEYERKLTQRGIDSGLLPDGSVEASSTSRSSIGEEVALSPSLFYARDDLGKTPLHHMIDRTTKDMVRQGRRDAMQVTQQLVMAHPASVGAADVDGLTPLMLVLMVPSFGDMEVELRVLDLVRMLLGSYPQAALGGKSWTSIAEQRWRVGGERRAGYHDPRVRPNPLSCALLYGRSEPTVQLLLETASNLEELRRSRSRNGKGDEIHHDGGSDSGGRAVDPEPTAAVIKSTATSGLSTSRPSHRSCLEIVSNDGEVPLHVAMTVRSPLSIVTLLCDAGPSAAGMPDRHGLTPVSWLWIRHVLDRRDAEAGAVFLGTHGQNTPGTQPIVKVSKRRYLPMDYASLHAREARIVEQLVQRDAGARSNVIGGIAAAMPLGDDLEQFVLLSELWEKARILLPPAAEATYQYQSATTVNENKPGDGTTDDNSLAGSLVTLDEDRTGMSPLHAASYLPSCPRPLLLLALHHHPNQLRCRDSHGSLPVHHAAASLQSSYTWSCSLPLGVNQSPEKIDESVHPVSDLLERFPKGSRLTDGMGRLPLHIAIDAERGVRTRRTLDMDAWGSLLIGSRTKCDSRQLPLNTGPVDSSTVGNMDSNLKDVDGGSSIVMEVLKYNTDALERRDKATGLYPFMLAAVGDGSNLNTAFALLREQPTLVSSGIN